MTKSKRTLVVHFDNNQAPQLFEHMMNLDSSIIWEVHTRLDSREDEEQIRKGYSECIAKLEEQVKAGQDTIYILEARIKQQKETIDQQRKRIGQLQEVEVE